MTNPQICVIGFGNIGCRHAQSFLNRKEKFTITVVEPNDYVFLDNCKKIGINCEQVKRYKNHSELSGFYDLLIISTTSNLRLDIIQNLNKKLFQNCLVEKIVFQSVNDFYTFLKEPNILENNYYVNFVNRYFATAKIIKEKFNTIGKLKLEVFGGNFNLGSNGVHYIDLFEYITGESCEFINGNVREIEAKKQERSYLQNI